MLATNNPLPNGIQTLELSQQNANQLFDYYKLRTFKPNSKLHQYLLKKDAKVISSNGMGNNLNEILTVFKNVIYKETLYDTKNPQIVFFNQELEEIFNVKWLHISEIKARVCAHFIDDVNVQPSTPIVQQSSVSTNAPSTSGIPLIRAPTPSTSGIPLIRAPTPSITYSRHFTNSNMTDDSRQLWAKALESAGISYKNVHVTINIQNLRENTPIASVIPFQNMQNAPAESNFQQPNVRANAPTESNFQQPNVRANTSATTMVSISVQQPTNSQNGQIYIPYWTPPNIGNKIYEIRENSQKPFDTNGRYLPSPSLLPILRSVEGVGQNKVVFYFNEIVQILIKYVFNKHDKFFDKRNQKVAYIDGDPLGKCFNVRAFDKCQLCQFIKMQIMPFESFRPQDSQEPECSLKNLNEDSDNETVYSCQGYETEKCCDEYSDENEENNDEDVYEGEYEIVSSTSHDDNSNDTSGYSDVENKKIDPINEKSEEFCNWAEDEKEEYQPMEYSLNDAIKSKCIKCSNNTFSYFKYCGPCWKDVFRTVPKRSVPRTKRKRSLVFKDEAKIDSFLNEKKQKIDPPVIKEEITSFTLLNNEKCSICAVNKIDSSLIHGQTEHQFSCYECAKKVFKAKRRCPLCRQLIEKIVKSFKH